MTTPRPAPLRVVIDTSVILPALTGNLPQHNWLNLLWSTGRIIPLVNDETIAELREKILGRSPSTKAYQADIFVRKTIRPYQLKWEHIPLQEVTSPLCRDQKDQKFIDLAFTGNADYLLTRDKDILEMDVPLPFEVITEPEFRGMIQS